MLRVECATVGLFFFKRKTAYEVRISAWSSDVCSSDLVLMPIEVVQDGDQLTGEDGIAHGEIRHAGNPQCIMHHVQQRLGGVAHQGELGRASWRERVCQDV